ADQRDHVEAAALAGPALRVPVGRQMLQVLLQPAHPPDEPPPVDLELRLAGATVADGATGADAAPLLAERLLPAPQSGEPVAQERQLDLIPTLGRAGVLGEDVEDHGGTVDGGAAQDLL